MAEQLYKLSPHRDLQCYFLMPSAIAAMSQASASGFMLSGKWRQQFDWAVVEWNRDNVFEHPALRNLPDGDLSGLVLSYQEERNGCVPIESNLDPVVDWNNLRIWAPAGGSYSGKIDPNGTAEAVYHVSLEPLAVPIAGSTVPASATLTLKALPPADGSGAARVGVALLENHHYYEVQSADTLTSAASGIATAINGNALIIGNPDFSATSLGAAITISWKTGGLYPQLAGANGNRITVYGFASQSFDAWQQPAVMFSGGSFPTAYQVTLDFGALKAQGIPTDNVRKLRWTWAADLQASIFQQTEFQVQISDWSVTGSNRIYSVAGPGSRRIEDTDSLVSYSESWSLESGNYSASKIHVTTTPGESCALSYSETAPHQLLLGTRRTDGAAIISVVIDGNQLGSPIDLSVPQEDILVRLPLGSFGPGSHTISATHTGSKGEAFFFDFLQIAYASESLPDFSPHPQLALATDWDTYHSQSLPAERTAWLITKLGFTGRLNHYVGALWFYEIVRTGTQYASLTATLNPLTYSGSPTVVLAIAPADAPTDWTLISHLVLLDDTAANVAEALAGLINLGTNLVWAASVGNQLTITARFMGITGNGIIVKLDPSSEGYSLTAPSNELSGGIDGTPYDLASPDPLNDTLTAAASYWRTDLNAVPRINRAARDWHAAFFAALKNYGMDAVSSFSTELMNGDPSAQVGIAQRYPDGTPVVLNTPAIQTNFSPTALAFWTQVYLDMALLQFNAGMRPYLQSGEVQWWYFPKDNVGMPFYDDYAKQQFQAEYGQPIQTILDNTVDPALYPDEVAFLPALIGKYTAAIRSALRATYPDCRYEILFPTDVNFTPFNMLINFAADDWTPANLDCMKTESFGFTGSNNLDESTYSISVSAEKGFANLNRSHLIGIGDAWTAWMKEADIAEARGLESIVLFALDQYCLIGYPPPPFVNSTNSKRQG